MARMSGPEGWTFLWLAYADYRWVSEKLVLRSTSYAQSSIFFAIFEEYFCKEYAGDKKKGPEGWILFHLDCGVLAAAHTRRMGGSPSQFRFTYLNVWAAAHTYK